MSALTNHLVRRGIDEFQSRAGVTASQGGEKQHIPQWAALLVCTTILAFVFGLFAIQYTYMELIGTLAAVEAPSTTAIIRTAAPEESDEPDAPLLGSDEKQTLATKDVDQEILLIKQRPLTSRFCAIKRHLRARGGRGARFRGLHIYIFNALLSNIILGFFTSFVMFRRSILMLGIAEVLTETLLTRFSLLWTHTVISEPSTRSWRQRLLPRSTIVKALAPTAIAAMIAKLSTVPSLYVVMRPQRFQSPPSTINDTRAAIQDLIPFLIVALVTIVMSLGVQIPIQIAITRVRASLLDSEEEPIIPFDRTFNSQVVSTAEGGTGILGLFQAWAGCDMQTRLRVLGVYLKSIAMQISLMLFGTMVVLAELRLIMGPDYLTRLALMFMMLFV